MLAFLLAAGASVAADSAPQWRAAAFGSETGNMAIAYVDQASIERTGEAVRFRLDMRLRAPLPSGQDRLEEVIAADCATRSWRGERNWTYEENGRPMRATEVLETTAASGTVDNAVLTAACTGAFESGVVADVDRHARLFIAATGTIRERLIAAEAAR